MRLDKYLVTVEGSRTEVKQVPAKNSGQWKVETSAMFILIQIWSSDLSGRKFVYEEFVYYLLNKPKGRFVTEDDRHQTVLDLLDDTG